MPWLKTTVLRNVALHAEATSACLGGTIECADYLSSLCHQLHPKLGVVTMIVMSVPSLYGSSQSLLSRREILLVGKCERRDLGAIIPPGHVLVWRLCTSNNILDVQFEHQLTLTSLQ